MAAFGFNRSDLARRIWGTTKDSRGYQVAQNRDRIGVYLTGRAYPSMKTLWALGEVLEVFPDDIRCDRLTSDAPFSTCQRGPRAMTQLHRSIGS